LLYGEVGFLENNAPLEFLADPDTLDSNCIEIYIMRTMKAFIQIYPLHSMTIAGYSMFTEAIFFV